MKAVAIASPLVAILLSVFVSLPAWAQESEKKVQDQKPGEALKVGTTLENLVAAFEGESNANARYLAFAKKADEEGYAPVGSLFRAAARAEAIHAENHANVIRALGKEPKATIATPEVGSTRENLEAAIAGETYEQETMYPAFLKQARKDRDRAALQTFNYAKTAEIEHARLYKEALAGLDGLKSAASKNYYVCKVCGYTTTKVDFSKCPSCFAPKEEYELVS